MDNLGEVCESFNAPLASPPELFQLAVGCRDAWTSEALCPLSQQPGYTPVLYPRHLYLQPLNDFNPIFQADESRIGYIYR